MISMAYNLEYTIIVSIKWLLFLIYLVENVWNNWPHPKNAKKASKMILRIPDENIIVKDKIKQIGDINEL